MRGSGLVALVAGGLLLTGCGQDDKPAPTASAPTAAPAPPAAPTSPAPAATPAASTAVASTAVASAGDAAKGKQVWLGQCVACHNPDPAKDGPIGPAVKGSSPSLVETRVLHATYPPGYKPKRETKVMPARPDLTKSIPDLAAFLR